MENKKELTPQEVFDDIKSKRNKVTDKELKEFYNSNLRLAEKYLKTGQVHLIEKLSMLINNYEKEMELIKLGIDSYIYKDDVTEFLDRVENNAIVFIELHRYPRDIPDDIVDTIEKTKDIFDKMYVLFTDYTGEVRSKIEEERREKDPILFGVFEEESSSKLESNKLVNDRFYFLGDWEDEYCDLTMDKFLNIMNLEDTEKINTPINEKEIIEMLNAQKPLQQRSPKNKKEGFFTKFIKGLRSE